MVDLTTDPPPSTVGLPPPPESLPPPPEHAVSTGHVIRIPDTPVLVTVNEIRVTRRYDNYTGATTVQVVIEAESE